jgi:uncharacterized membrane protein YedE/YeeE
MFAELGFETLTPREAAIGLGLLLGLLFGALAEVTRFCLRRAVAGEVGERAEAQGVWLAALAVAVVAVQAAVGAGWISFAGHRFFAADLPWAAVLAGGLMFGAGMVLTRGCVSRLTVLAGTGNLRAFLVLTVFAITAHATLKGVLAPVRTALGSLTLPLGEAASLAALPGGPALWAGLIAVGALAVAKGSGASLRNLGHAAGIGLLAAAGWVGTGFVLHDEFDPIALESLSFTSPAAETLFWSVASTSIPAGFGVGLLGGVVAGAFLASLIGGRFRWQSFESPGQTGRYLAGAALMGLGGVFAGGCTVGAGLSGVPTLSVAAILALLAIAAGARLTAAALGELSRPLSGSAGSAAIPQALPAE